MPSISVITPSIRPEGLKVVEGGLAMQTFRDFEWIRRLSVPGPVPDLCRSVNSALREATGDLVVFLQDYIKIGPDGLKRFWEKFQQFPNACYTAPVGKTFDWKNVEWEWRTHHQPDALLEYYQWEIDWGAAPRSAIVEVGGFDEDYDSGFGWENVDLALRLKKAVPGLEFRVDPENRAVAFDHDKFIPHPFKGRPNRDLWVGKQREIESGIVRMKHL